MPPIDIQQCPACQLPLVCMEFHKKRCRCYNPQCELLWISRIEKIVKMKRMPAGPFPGFPGYKIEFMEEPK